MKYILLLLLTPLSLLAFVPADLGRSITALQTKPARGLVQGETYTITEVQDDGTHAQTSGGGVGIHITHLGLQWEWTSDAPDPEPDPDPVATYDRNETKDFYYGFTEDFASSGWGNVGEYRFVAKLSITAHWRYFASSGGSWTITINSYDIVAHNIPSDHFNVGIDTWRLSEINSYEPLMGSESQLGGNVYLASTSANILPRIYEPTPGLTTSRDITLRYGVTFNRVNHTNTQEPPYTFYYTLPVNIKWDYDDT